MGFTLATARGTDSARRRLVNLVNAMIYMTGSAMSRPHSPSRHSISPTARRASTRPPRSDLFSPDPITRYFNNGAARLK